MKYRLKQKGKLMFELPEYHEIPNVGLYLEQTLKYINETFSAFRSVELTKSMISNYVKLGYIRRPVKKQYDREQIASLLFIAVSKQVLSMENIGKFFRMQEKVLTAEQAYTAFRGDFDYLLDIVWNQKMMGEEEVALLTQPASPDGSERIEDDAAGDPALTLPKAYALLWQVASADAYSIFLNELFEHTEEAEKDTGSR